uniref:probable phospholipid-transporting ATPase IA isoform X2 n=1 Tax=Ciona intestinalis TaxID=7719 RepID=UPI0005214F7F|nr:probable phospholipid-transporting ATPase IA isoform X2 [Ciona intestinalis]|eukprot:XP_009857629.1 probable phospholipid-transporting ATPase IA isoform X2 [Ciona intestinalis]
MERIREFFGDRGIQVPFGNSSVSASQQDNGTRTIYFNQPLEEQTFLKNEISTGKYNFLTFLPLFLFEQFRKVFNIFFLIICILQQIPGISPTGKYTTIVPLVFILLVAAIKEIVEDYKRHRADDAVNNRKVEVFRDGTFVELAWTQVVVGDIVKVVSGKFFPADLILLSSSEPQAMCYIETANLDGETNLKIRQGIPATSEIQSSEDLLQLHGMIECESPNRHLYSFNGSIKLNEDRLLPLGPDQILLRGAMLRNTKWIFGVVVYTGHESKLMKNANRAPLKMSNVDRTTNMQIWFLMAVLIVISLASAIGSEVWKKETTQRWYLNDTGTGPKGFFMELLTFIILYNNLVPISLLVTLEVVKFIQAIFINSDLDMYFEPTDTPAMARTSNLNEELGQVKYIFSDKTGTLTENIMEFKKCSVAGIKYGEGISERPGCYFYDESFVENLQTKSNYVHEFTTMMSVCHTVVPEKVEKVDQPTSSNRDDQDGDDNLENIQYQSSSPDENAIVKAARNLGYVFCVRTPTHVVVRCQGKDESYEVLNVLEFSSTRKRMSVIVRAPDGRIILMCKGADNVIFERLSEKSQFKFETENHLRDYARDGLRTLCFAQTELNEAAYKKWNDTVYYEASTAVVDRDKKLSDAYEAIEKNLFLLGTSAIEDKLQQGVPETIATLSAADIKIWVLTGDKQETAINIAYSSQLVNNDMSLVILNDSTLEKTKQTMEEAICDIRKELTCLEEAPETSKFALIVTGSTLQHALHKELEETFLDLALSCKAVVCCRVSPIQKAMIVELVKKNCNAITLAIGDGANDVSMIQAAHVGVGISGQEGLQAANSSDYSIAQFAFLGKLLLVHGAWNYNRLTKCILFSFYKNICLYLIELWFAFYNGFSGQILFDRWTISFYNVFFTALPPFTLGLFERTCSSKVMLKHPQLYSISQSASKYNAKVFWAMFANATVHSLMLFYIPMYSMKSEIAFSSGKTGGYLFLGNFVYTFTVITVCLKAGLESGTWTILTHIAVWGSFAIWLIFFGIYSHIFSILPLGSEMLGQADNVMASPVFWLGLILVPPMVLFRDLLWKVFRRRFQKSVVERVQELEVEHIDPQKTILDGARQSLSERAHLLRNMFGMGRNGSRTGSDLQLQEDRDRSSSLRSLQDANHGYAFSQEEGGVVSQSQLIRQYNTSNERGS